VLSIRGLPIPDLFAVIFHLSYRRFDTHWPCASIQKEPILGILHYPFEALLKVQSSQCTALHNVPPMRVNRVESQGLRGLLESVSCLVNIGTPPRLAREPQTLRISSELMHPATSLLFLNTSRLAPINRCHSDQSRLRLVVLKPFTSCRRSPSSSCRQSSIRSRSVPSTTHMSVSVFSK
jgi:hypothetical protein